MLPQRSEIILASDIINETLIDRLVLSCDYLFSLSASLDSWREDFVAIAPYRRR